MTKATFKPLDVYKILPQTNCQKCLLPSCLAFAAAIVAGSKKFKECPDLDQSAMAAFSARYQSPGLTEMNQADSYSRCDTNVPILNNF